MNNIAISILFYSVCSSTLLVINKLAVKTVQSTSLVLTVQFLASVLAVMLANRWNPAATKLEQLTVSKCTAFSGVVLLFCFCLYANVKALELNSVETVIVFRALTPIGVCLLEYRFLGRELPGRRSFLALLAIASGAGLYSLSSPTSTRVTDTSGQLWLLAYFAAITSELAFVKYIIESLPMSTWTRMYYNNLLSIPVVLLMGLCSDDLTPSRLNLVTQPTWSSFAILLLAGVVGVAISYAAFQLRSLVSATSFTVVGVLCKLGTVLISRLVWRENLTFLGYCGLGLCILAGCCYEQAPKKPTVLVTLIKGKPVGKVH